MLRAVRRRLAFVLTAGLLAAAACSDAPRGEDGAGQGGVQVPAPDATGLDGGKRPAGGRIGGDELAARLGTEGEPLLIDVRSREEFASGHIPGAVNIPYDELPGRFGELAADRDDEVVVYCRTGRRAKIAESALSEAGFRNVRDLEGHMTAWSEARRPVTEAVPCC